MTVVSGTTAVSNSSSNASSAASANTLAKQQIAGNFQSFLQLLTTQLQNQNPLDPLDTNQFTQQLVEFAGVQEQINTNDSLASLVSLQQTAAGTQALTYVGKVAVVSGNMSTMTNSQASWGINVPSNSNVTITVANSAGQTVYTTTQAMSAGNDQTFTWNGQGNDGTQWPDGNYTVSATAADSSGNAVAVTTEVAGTISAVDLSQSPPLLTINGQSYTTSQIKSIAN